MKNKINFAYKMLTNSRQNAQVVTIVPSGLYILAHIVVTDDHYIPPLFWRITTVLGGDYLSLTMRINVAELEMLMM